MDGWRMVRRGKRVGFNGRVRQSIRDERGRGDMRREKPGLGGAARRARAGDRRDK